MTTIKLGANLKVVNDQVISYSTHVATIDGKNLIVVPSKQGESGAAKAGKWSKTTSRHINEVAKHFGLTRVEGKQDEKSTSFDTVVANIAVMGEIFGNTKKEKNDWKARMLKAGLENKGLTMPDDWNTLSEDEKEKRLNGVIKILREK